MNIKKIGVGLFLLILNWNLFSQIDTKHTTLPTIIPPTPDVSNLMRFEEVPVDNYSGKPNISFPVFTKNLKNGVSIPISLIYNTMAIRIDERSGWTGTGWSLNGLPVISRTVRNLPDEINEVVDSKRMIGVFNNGYFDLNWGNITQNNQNSDIQNFLWNASNKGSAKYVGTNPDADFDNESDLFQISLFNASARFVIVKQGNNLIPKMLSNDANLKVIIDFDSVDFSINHFTIYDTNGNKYLFNVEEMSNSNNGSLTIDQLGNQNSLSINEMNYVSSWKLKNIKTPNNKELATFNYQLITEQFETPKSLTESRITGMTVPNNQTITDINLIKNFWLGNGTTSNEFTSFNLSNSLPRYAISFSTIIAQSQKISSIIFNDQSSIIFEIDTANNSHPEYQANSGTRLKNIIIKDSNTNENKRYVLNQSTTFNNRLFLDSIDEQYINGATILNYSFEYILKNSLPEFGSDKKDIWGYYSEEVNLTSSLGYNNNKFGADLDNVLKGSLNTITYPNGGVKEFIFESNTFFHRGSEAFSDEQNALYNPDNWLPDPIPGNLQFDNLPIGNFLSDESVNFSIEYKHFVFIETTLTSGTFDSDSGITIKKVESNGTLTDVPGAGCKLNDSVLIELETGDYRMFFQSLVINPLHVDIRFKYKQFKSPLSNYIYGGGLRIKEINFYENQTTIIPERSFNFSYINNLATVSELSSSGVIDGFLTNRKEYARNVQNSFYSSVPFSGHVNQNVITDYDITEYLNDVYVSLTKSNFVGYKEVSIEELNNGKTINYYSSPEEYSTYETTYSYPFIPREDKSYLHGNIKKNMVYDNDEKLIQEIEYNYYSPFIENNSPQSLFIYEEECYYTQFYRFYDDYIIKNPTFDRRLTLAAGGELYESENCLIGNSIRTPVNYSFYNHVFAKHLLEEKITKEHFYSSLGVEKIVENLEHYTYNMSNYQLSVIEKTDSHNNTIRQELYYVDDTLPSTIFTASEISNYNLMSANNMIVTPIYQKEFNDGELNSSIKNIR